MRLTDLARLPVRLCVCVHLALGLDCEYLARLLH